VFYFIQTQKLLTDTSQKQIDSELTKIEKAIIRAISK